MSVSPHSKVFFHLKETGLLLEDSRVKYARELVDHAVEFILGHVGHISWGTKPLKTWDDVCASCN